MKVLDVQDTKALTRGLITMAATHSTAEFFNLIMMTDKMVAFGMMFPGSPYLVVAHSCGMYRDFGNSNNVENGAYAFVGAGNTAVSLSRGWLNSKSTKKGPIDNAPIKAQMTSDPTQLWGGYESLDEDKKEVKDAPAMLLLFPALAKFLQNENRTPLEALVLMDSFSQKNNVNEGDVEVYYKYLKLAACAKKSTSNESIMALSSKPLILPSKDFQKWREKRLEGTGVTEQIAAVVTPTTSPQATLSNHQQSQNADDIKHLTAAVTVMAESMGTVVTHSAKGSKSKPTKLSSRNIWRLAGLCRVTCKSHIPPIWYEMLRADTLADCVALLKEAKKRENDLKNAWMNRPVYFES